MRGLLCIEPLYHQVVKGLKTQTRRSGGLDVVNNRAIQMNGHQRSPDDWGIAAAGLRPYPHNQISSVLFIRKGIKRGEMKDTDSVILKPRYRVGEVLYLKEPVSVNLSPEKSFYYYDLSPDHDYRDRKYFKWPNKLFMPASAARAFIKITSIRCERLLDISDEDCIAEGIEIFQSIPIHGERYKGYKNYLRSKNGGRDMLHSCEYYVDMFPHRPDLSAKRSSFMSLYKFANKVKEVENIFVWVYEFEYLPNYKA